MLNLRSSMIGTEDAEGSVAFYTKVLGEPAWAEGGYTGWPAIQFAYAVRECRGGCR